MGFPYYDQVQRAHSELLASGQIARRTNQEATEHDKGLVTRRAGYYVNLQDASIGLLAKTSGNNALGYSVDLLISKAGFFWDVATDNAGLAMPVDGNTRGPDPALALQWRQPTPALAGLTDLSVPPPDGDVMPYDENKSIEFGQACNATYAECGMPREECLTKHVNEFRAVYGLPPL